MKSLKYIRKQSKGMQTHVAFIVAALGALSVTLLWIPTLPTRLSHFGDTTEAGLAEREQTDQGNPAPEKESLAASLADALRNSKGTTTDERVRVYTPDDTTETKSTSSIRFIE